MALLSFPSSPVNGQLYPVLPTIGQNQYQWEAVSNTWRLIGTATAVTPGIYGNADNIPQLTIDVTGRITIASNIPIGSSYVKTNNLAAYNGYTWPNSDGGVNEILTTDGSGVLSWQNGIFTNFWQKTGAFLSPATNGDSLFLTDSSGNITLLSDSSTSETEFVKGTSAVVISPNPTGVSTITSAGIVNASRPLGFLGSDFAFSAYGNSFLNTPSSLTFTQSLLSTSTALSSGSIITSNAGTLNSVSSPPTRGTAGQILISNGNGTTSFVTNPEQGFWTRAGNILFPKTSGDNVEIRSLANIPVIELNSTGTASFINGLQRLFIDPGYGVGEVQLRAIDSFGAGSMTLDANNHTLRSFGNVFTNIPTQFQLDYATGISFNADIVGVRRNLFEVNLNGDLDVGYNVDFGASALGVDGLTGNTKVGGILTVNNGIGPGPTPGPNSFTFPNNRGIGGYVLRTDGSGGTAWQPASLLTGYWTESGSTLDIFPSAAGQNVVIRNASSVNKIELFSTGYMVAYGGLVTAPTYSVSNNGTGMYGSNIEINFAINSTQVAKFDQNFFYSYGEIKIEGAATNANTIATIENDNSSLRFVASGSVLTRKNIEFEIAENVQAGFFNTTGDFAVTQGNATIGSSTIVTYVDSTNLAIGSAVTNQGGLIKFVSLFNGGDGVELNQDESTGDFNIRMDHTAPPVVEINSTDTFINTTLEVLGDTTLSSELYLPSPTVPPSGASPGLAGQISWDANYIYVCVALNLWKRGPIETW